MAEVHTVCGLLTGRRLMSMRQLLGQEVSSEIIDQGCVVFGPCHHRSRYLDESQVFVQ